MKTADASTSVVTKSVVIPVGDAQLTGALCIPAETSGVVLFVNGTCGSCARTQYVARILNEARIGTLLFDPSGDFDEPREKSAIQWPCDTEFLAERVIIATKWIGRTNIPAGCQRVGYFAFENAAGGALTAAATLGSHVGAIVCYDGRAAPPDASLATIEAPTLLIVGENDDSLLKANRRILGALECEKKLSFVSSARKLVDEASLLQDVAWLAAEWFLIHLQLHPGH